MLKGFDMRTLIRPISAMLGLCLLVPACRDDTLCTAISKTSVQGTVTDSAGNPVPVTSARALWAGRERACDVESSSYRCQDLEAGKATIEVVAIGQTAKGEVSLTWSESSECHTNSETLDFALSDADCPAVEGEAIRGTLRDSAGQLADSATVSVTWDGWSAVERACEVENGAFACAAVTPYPTTYRLTAQLGTSVVIEQVEVAADECAVTTATLAIDLSTRTCPEEGRTPAVSGWVLEQDRPVQPERAQAKLDDGEFFECSIDDTGHYSCPARGKTGGGRYSVVVTVRGEAHTLTVDVQDDGCAPLTGDGLIDLDKSKD